MSFYQQILTLAANLLIAVVFNPFNLSAQVPLGFHPRHCLDQEDFLYHSIESDYTADGFYGNYQLTVGSGSAQYFLQLTKDKESGELKASCATPEVGGEPAKIRKQIKPEETTRVNSGVSLIPNPAKDVVIIRNGYQSAVYIFDYTGRQVLFRQLGADTKLDISALNCGIYSVKVDRGNLVYNLQLMIQR